MKENNATDRILFIRFSAMGDVAMTIPVIYSFALQYPNVRIYVATQMLFGQMFINRPPNVDVLPVNLESEYKGFFGIIRLIRRLAALRPDYVFDMHNVLRTWLACCYFLCIGTKVFTTSKHRYLRWRVINGSAQAVSMIDSHIKALNNAGFYFQMTFKSIMGSCIPQRRFAITKPSIGIAPFARYINKRYPLDKVENIISSLADEGFNVYLFGGKNERIQLNVLARKYKNVTSVDTCKSFEEELKVMSKLDIMITMDSANHHLASLVGTRVVSIWGGTTPACGFMAYSQSLDDAVFLGLDCQPCTIAGSDRCRRKDFACLNELSETRIINHVKQSIKRYEQNIE